MKKNVLLFRFEHFVILILLLIFFIGSLQNWDFFFVPNVDIYQYLCDARNYYYGHFPNYVQPQPLYSLLIFPISMIFLPFGFPEIKAGIVINIFSTILSLTGIWIFSRRYLNVFWRLILMTLLVSHPLIFYTAVNTTPEALLLVCVIYTLLFYQRKSNLAYLCATLAAFVKYEGFVMIAMLLVTDFILIRKERSVTKRINIRKFVSKRTVGVIGVLALIVWEFIIISYNYQQLGASNYYFQEIQQTTQPLPDWRKVSRLIDLLQANTAIYNTGNTNNDVFEAAVLILLFVVVLLVSFQKGSWNLFQSVGFCIGYLLIHSLFPAYSPRYFQPILGFILLYICILFQFLNDNIRKYQLIVLGIIVCLVLSWIYDLWNYKYSDFMAQDRYIQAEERLAGDWLHELQKDDGEYAIIASDAQRISYYLDDSNIKKPFVRGILNRPLCDQYPFLSNASDSRIMYFSSTYPTFSSCGTAKCLVDLLPKKFEKVIVFHTAYSNFSMSIDKDEMNCFKQIQELSANDLYNDRIVKIYEFQNELCK